MAGGVCGEDFACLETATMHPWIEFIFGNVKAILTIIGFNRSGLGWLLASRLKSGAFVFDRMETRIKKGTNQGVMWSLHAITSGR
jgi:hypothetical protein